MDGKGRIAAFSALAGVVGSCLSAYLLLAPILGAGPVCVGPGCDAVLASQVAQPWGVPLSAFGLAVHLAFVWLPWVWAGGGPRAKLAFQAGYGLAVVAAATSLILTGYSALILRAVCLICLGSAMLVLLQVLLYALLPIEGLQPGRAYRGRVALAVMLAFVLGMSGVALQLQRDRMVAFSVVDRLNAMPTDEVLPPGRWWWGQPNAGTRLLVLHDMECGACHDLVRQLAPQVAEGQIAVLLRHAPRPRHPGAYELAIAMETASLAGKSDRFLAEYAAGRMTDATRARSWLGHQGVRANSHLIASAKDRVDQDVRFSEELEITSVPVTAKRLPSGQWVPLDGRRLGIASSSRFRR